MSQLRHNKWITMNSFMTGLLGIAIFLLLITGCAPHHMVILAPDPDGHLGQAEVITQGGSQLLEKSGATTTVSGRLAAPSPATISSPEFIAATFADVIAIEPTPPEKFILFFHKSTTELIYESQATITAILEAITRRAAVNISISGHTDSAGAMQLNEDLARSRALTIRDLLIQEGVAAERLTVSFHGKGNQLVPTADGVAEPRNRRVEVIVH